RSVQPRLRDVPPDDRPAPFPRPDADRAPGTAPQRPSGPDHGSPSRPPFGSGPDPRPAHGAQAAGSVPDSRRGGRRAPGPVASPVALVVLVPLPRVERREASDRGIDRRTRRDAGQAGDRSTSSRPGQRAVAPGVSPVVPAHGRTGGAETSRRL